jgi:hypothetical protein
VVEPVPTAGLLDHDAGLRCLFEGVDEVPVDEALDQFHREPTADHRGRRKRLVRLHR